MTPYITLAIGLLILGFTCLYSSWVKWRVWILRQDLFEIRDRLWDHAATHDLLQQAEYRRARKDLNSLVRFAPRLSLPVWLHFKEAGGGGNVRRQYEIPEVKKAMDEAYRRVTVFIFLQTLSGFAYFVWRLVQSHSRNEKRTVDEAAAKTKRYMNPDELYQVEKEYACIRRNRRDQSELLTGV